MEDINIRIKELRKTCNKTQSEWGKILGISSSGVADLESGRRNINEKHLIMLSNWHERKVNIEWLRTGEGGKKNMFLHPEENDLIAQATELLGVKDPLFESLVVTFVIFRIHVQIAFSFLKFVRDLGHLFKRILKKGSNWDF